MGLVTAKEVAKAINAEKYGVFGTFSGWLLMKVFKISTINKFYKRNNHLQGLNFLDSILIVLAIALFVVVIFRHMHLPVI